MTSRADQIGTVLGESVGLATVAWENMSDTGVFQDDIATQALQQITDELKSALFLYSEWLDGERLMKRPKPGDSRSHADLVHEFLTESA